ncbi:DUF1629 domain-containing protein [Xanthomonas hortorum]|uniref:Immunity MXAN-0049 protein domain-containing protein n=3 Tax=Xanthomonas hortorum TaxID=56454 RepID=A0A6V7DN11_9XANT|nr:DUF1629 domain-containing protein [Xanthomonas hortorum]APP80396.1 hypothetical protein BJD10_12415 [Xanthomonas hortorum pv. gardneri]EGD20717.1 Protein of unknown function (DUF1629) [Xanthomonas hortorum ATCC 19865]KLA94273.1 hypothetical protein SM19410_18485 [Xanthomonas hortorum pv. gardneri]KLA99544.1 hypothetical protein SM17710_09325 [Xanthomonas hortorum pv. gardneri]KLB03425.1 hypothetical protein SM18210_10900 [Xanthomonas hortorum pv. gardneri]
METTTANQPKAGEFFILEAGTINGPVNGVVFENVKNLLSPPRLTLRPEGGGFPPLRETPRLVYHPSKGPPPKDLEPGFSGYWLVSARLYQVMASVDPTAFAFAEVDYRLADGAKGPPYFLCDVIQEIDALDEEASKLFIDTTEDFVNGKFYDLTGGASVTFDRVRLGPAHVFKTPYTGRVFCDQVFKDAAAAAGIETDTDADGLWFIDASDI